MKRIIIDLAIREIVTNKLKAIPPLLAISVWLVGSLVAATGFAEEMPDSIRTIYLKDGKTIECDMAWLDGDKLVYRKYGGNLTIGIEKIDMARTLNKSAEKEKSSIVARDNNVYTFGDILVRNLRVSRVDAAKRGLANRVELEVINSGEPAFISVNLTACSEDGYVYKRVTLSTRSRLYKDQALTLSETFSLSEEEYLHISSWFIKGAYKQGQLEKERAAPRRYPR